MKIIFHDWETYYSTKSRYSLTYMTPAEYILDQRFQPIGLSVQEGFNGKPYWVPDTDLDRYFADLDPNQMQVGHNNQFDASINSWRYGYAPALLSCTMNMAKGVYNNLLKRYSLASLSDFLGLPPKGDTVYKVDGMTLEDIRRAGFYDEYVEYSLGDVSNCAAAFQIMAATAIDNTGKTLFPKSELLVMDQVLRCVVEPRFVLDVDVLHDHLHQVKERKRELLEKVYILLPNGRTSLNSGPQFAKILESMGVDPPTKISPTTGEVTFAFSKTDSAFIELREHPDPMVQALVEARLGVKSSIEETRTQRFIDMSQMLWPTRTNEQYNPVPTQARKMPVPLRYSAALTHRLGGDWSLNMQNMSRANKFKPGSGRLRTSLKAAPGFCCMAVDAAQIEARMSCFFSGQMDVVEQFRRKEDVYASLASEIYHKPINKHDHPVERFVGKGARLGLQYQLWYLKFRSQMRAQSIDQLGYPIDLTLEEAENVVRTFRRLNDKIVQSWKDFDNIGIPVLVHGGEWDWGPVRFTHETITGPGGLAMHYPNMSKEQNKYGKMSWFYDGTDPKTGRHIRVDLYGGKVLENICQHLARQHTMDAAVRIMKRSRKEFGVPYHLALQAHDENVFLPRIEHIGTPVFNDKGEIARYAGGMAQIMEEEMCREDWWAPGFPFACDPVIPAPNYGEAK
jgi:hypothetical protein